MGVSGHGGIRVIQLNRDFSQPALGDGKVLADENVIKFHSVKLTATLKYHLDLRFGDLTHGKSQLQPLESKIANILNLRDI
jgi:hypothetical protein